MVKTLTNMIQIFRYVCYIKMVFTARKNTKRKGPEKNTFSLGGLVSPEKNFAVNSIL